MNTAILMGTLTKDVELRYFQNGTAVGNFSIAVNKKFKGQDGKLVEKVSFFDITAFGKTAEVINQFFRKGSRILVRGELEQETWETNDGQKRSRVVVRLDQFDFVDRKSDDDQQQGGYSQPSQQEATQPKQTAYRQPRQPRQPQSEAPKPPEVDVNEDEIPF